MNLKYYSFLINMRVVLQMLSTIVQISSVSITKKISSGSQIEIRRLVKDAQTKNKNKY